MKRRVRFINFDEVIRKLDELPVGSKAEHAFPRKRIFPKILDTHYKILIYKWDGYATSGYACAVVPARRALRCGAPKSGALQYQSIDDTLVQ